MNLNDYLIPDFDLTGNLTTEDTLYGLLSDDEEITGYLGLIEDIALSELSDVTLTSPVNGQVLKYDNGTWVNANETGGGSADYNLLLNKPSINTVPLTGNKTTAELGLFSGDYDDLTNKPSLATVATTGNYNDLSNRPTIPAAQVNSDWDAVAGVSQILNKPTIPAAQVNADWDAVSGVEEILNKPTLATVATSGDYDDLLNKPTIPTVKSDTLSNCTTDANGMVTNYYPSMTNRVILNALKLRTVGTGANDYVYITFAVNSTDTTYLLLAKNRDGSAYANKSGFTIKYWYMDI
jgi:hypothetical protein